MAYRIRDRYGNEIELTDERWAHIIKGHTKAFDRLPFDATHLVVIVKLIRNNFVVTAYAVQRGKRP